MSSVYSQQYYERHADLLKARAKARYVLHRDKIRAQMKDKRKDAGFRAAQRAYQLMKKFGVTPEQYDAMLFAQGGGCAICNGSAGGRWGRFYVDHDHKTGKVRGLLCRGCNMGIGNLRDDPEILERAAVYVRRQG